ncbi:MAG: 2-oxoglutarate dehydrogenase E1 component, partial [Saprospiraceae bacterium]
MKNLSFLTNAHPAYIEKLYMDYKADSEAVNPEWKQFFQGFELGMTQSTLETANISGDSEMSMEMSIVSLIHGYRSRGHLLSDTNPIRSRKDRKAHLQIHDYELQDKDLNYIGKAGVELGVKGLNIQQIIDRLNSIYCGKIGFEYAHIEDRAKRLWLRDRIENRNLSVDYGLSLSEKKRILEKLNGAVMLEKFLHTKYVGQKRFSLEGGESTIAALDVMINSGSNLGVEELVIGMAHRGRLNVLANIMGKTYEQIFSEFEGTAIPDLSFGSGDVKYHLGFSSMVESNSNKHIYLKLAPNPSHLEAVDPVVEGLARAKADLIYGSDYDKILPVLIHGDAAVAGQGVVF